MVVEKKQIIALKLFRRIALLLQKALVGLWV